MRKFVFLLLLIFVTVSQAQEAWRVWLYDAAAGEVILLGHDGAIQLSRFLPVPTEFLSYTFSRNLAVSPDGQRLAYSLYGQDSAETSIASFLVYDAANDALLFEHVPESYPTADSLLFSDVAWNNTGNTVAYSYAYGLSEEEDGWRVYVFNGINGQILNEESSESNYFSSQADRIAPYLLPVLQYHGEASLGFNLVPYQAYDFRSELDNYQWDIVTGRISRTNRAPLLTGDTWQETGETISPISDERINYDSASAPYTNALHIYRPEIASRAPFFATMTYDLLEADFVENGQKVVVRAEDMLSSEERYLLINRAGVSQALPQINPIDDVIMASPYGFVYMIDNETPFLLHLDTRDSSFPQGAIWQAPRGSRFVPVWASSLPQSDYDPWGQLAPPIQVEEAVVVLPDSSVLAQSVATITPIGSTGGFITVNSVAVIQTTGGDRLNMRDAPSLTGTIIARIDAGTRVVITDGPVAQDGFTWWEIRLPTAQIGWVVERTEGVQTLVPAN